MDCTTLDHLKFWLSVAGGAGAIVVFAVGLWQYSRAQLWKRAEFLSLEMKDLLADPRASNALLMIDWALRRIRLRALENPEDKERTVVTYEMQCRALQPHTVLGPVPGTGPAATAQTENNPDAAETVSELSGIGTVRHYSRDEALIRDCYDALLNRLDRLGGYLQRGLMSARDLEPYVGYYVRDVAAKSADEIEALWSVCFLTYVHFYHFDGVPALFKAFGRDVAPDGEIFGGFVSGVPEEARALAQRLQALAVEACRE